jgi:hypothetical protein
MKRNNIAWAGLIGAGLLVGVASTGARAEEGELFKSLMGSLGVIPEEKDRIDYRERAPLVLPPRTDLPQPAEGGGAQSRNRQWPNDPDVAAQRRRTAEERAPITETERHRMTNGSARLSPEEMRAGRRAGAGAVSAPESHLENGHWLNPDVLRAQTKGAQVAGDDNTGRRRLTEPPSAYRKSATGGQIKGSFDVPEKVDEADPRAFIRAQQQQRNP